jgi:hypothetical protein
MFATINAVYPGSASLRSMNSLTGINSRTAMCGTHEANVYFNQVKHFKKFFRWGLYRFE